MIGYKVCMVYDEKYKPFLIPRICELEILSRPILDTNGVFGNLTFKMLPKLGGLPCRAKTVKVLNIYDIHMQPVEEKYIDNKVYFYKNQKIMEKTVRYTKGCIITVSDAAPDNKEGIYFWTNLKAARIYGKIIVKEYLKKFFEARKTI